MNSFRFGRYRILPSPMGFSVQKRFLIFFWEEICCEYTYRAAKARLDQLKKSL